MDQNDLNEFLQKTMDALQTLTYTVQRLEQKVEALEQKNKQHE